MLPISRILRKTEHIFAPGREEGEDKGWHRLRAQMKLAQRNKNRHIKRSPHMHMNCLQDFHQTDMAIREMLERKVPTEPVVPLFADSEEA